MLDCRHEHLDRIRTFPFSVVAANNWDSLLAPADDRIECVIVQASGCNRFNVRQVCAN
jgi:hypothetical protein